MGCTQDPAGCVSDDLVDTIRLLRPPFLAIINGEFIAAKVSRHRVWIPASAQGPEQYLSGARWLWKPEHFCSMRLPIDSSQQECWGVELLAVEMK
jgi:hypothetical protein